MKQKIKFIYFDIGGVILKWRGLFEVIVRKTGKDISEIERIYKKYDHLACRGMITPQELWIKFCHELKSKEHQKTDFPRLSMESFLPIKETHNFLEEIVSGMPIGILSNIYHGFYDLSLKHGHIPNLNYRLVVQSCRIGLVKPEKAIYHHAQKKAKVPPGSILLVDDLEINVKAAKLAGWQAILFQTDNPQKSIKLIRDIISE